MDGRLAACFEAQPLKPKETAARKTKRVQQTITLGILKFLFFIGFLKFA
jgi:hypothetical protein